MAAEVERAVNARLTLRNSLIGRYIREYEQDGTDRADYGSPVLEQVSEELQKSLDRDWLTEGLVHRMEVTDRERRLVMLFAREVALSRENAGRSTMC